MKNKLNIIFYIQFIAYFFICLLKDVLKLPNSILTTSMLLICALATLFLIYINKKGQDSNAICYFALIFIIINENIYRILRSMNITNMILLGAYLFITFIIYFIGFKFLTTKYE